MPKYVILGGLCVIILFSGVSSSHAGAALEQRLRAARQQRAAYQQSQQQAIQSQRQAQQRAIYQQQVQRRQVQIMQQQMAQQTQAAVAQQRVIQQQLQQNAIQQQQAAYNQAIKHQQQLYQQQVSSDRQQLAYAPTAPAPYPVYQEHVEEVVEMGDIWKDLAISSEVWPLIIDFESKEVIVAKFIEDYRSQGIVIDKKPMHYVQLIDSMSFDNPSILNNPFDKVLQIVAIVEYDFDNGSNPDALARRILGESAYQQNKQRLNK